MKILRIAVLCSLGLAAGCAHLEGGGEPGMAADAKGNYELGMEALESNRFQDAVKYFEQVRYKFPYSAHAALADLALADTFFEQEKYTEAVDAYREFLKLHPNHPRADYAAFRIALSHYKDIPSDFFIFPPSSEKDQTAVRAARAALEDFLRSWPSSKHVPEAQKLLEDVRHRLAKHEMYVADFYLHRKKWQAAVGRLNRLLAELPGTGYDAEALLKLGRSYKELGDKQKAREVLDRLLREHPSDSRKGEAEQLLKSLA